jgi:hypothetical protein
MLANSISLLPIKFVKAWRNDYRSYAVVWETLEGDYYLGVDQTGTGLVLKDTPTTFEIDIQPVLVRTNPNLNPYSNEASIVAPTGPFTRALVGVGGEETSPHVRVGASRGKWRVFIEDGKYQFYVVYADGAAQMKGTNLYWLVRDGQNLVLSNDNDLPALELRDTSSNQPHKLGAWLLDDGSFLMFHELSQSFERTSSPEQVFNVITVRHDVNNLLSRDDIVLLHYSPSIDHGN